MAIILSVSSAYSSGFALYEGSAAGNVDAASVTAKGGEPGAVFYNPASITGLEGTQVQFGSSLVIPHAEVKTTNPYTGNTEKATVKSAVWPLPHAYVTHKINDDLWFGLGLSSRFGLGSEYDETWAGRYNSYKAEILSFAVNPNLAWKVNDWFSVAAGITVQYLDIELKQKLDVAGMMGLRKYNDPSPSPYDVDQCLSGDDFGYGYNFGIQVKPTEKLSIGLSYNSRIEHNCSGDGEWIVPDAIKAAAPGAFQNTDVIGSVTLPDTIMFAATYDITDSFTIGAGVTYTHWSMYDKLTISLDHPMLPGRDKLESRKEWENTWRYSVGGSYDISESLTLRASYTYDPSPFNATTIDYLIPADDRHLLAVGAGWTTGDWTFDVSYFYEIIEDLDVKGRPQDGVSESKFCGGYASVLGFSVTKRF